ncbi:MAG: hypothetical protein ACK2UV_05905, partial [Candidatus Promineifilaceae bacterium]
MKKSTAESIYSFFDTGNDHHSLAHEAIPSIDGGGVGLQTTLFLQRASRALALIVLATMPLLFGAVQAWVWSVYAVAMYAAFAMGIMGRRESSRLSRLNGWWAAVVLFMAVTLMSCLPLTPGLLAWLSPVRTTLLSRVQEVSGMAPATWTVSYTPLYSLAWWSLLLGLVLLFRVLRVQFSSRGFLKMTLWVLLGMSVLEALYGILQALLPNLGVLWVTYMKSTMGNARGTYINRNHFAGLMEMMLPLLMGFGLSRVSWGGRPKMVTLLHSERLHQHILMILGLVIMAL